ncbi:RNA polymerase sigma factor [Maribacter sp. 2307UL18-2]|uniref:RNA polymerase sigma factor n=1 Tax=Maribacter sp. 2307UL18-2 TaxID=3386274 RepID=UPI0039BCCBEF
MQESSRTNTLEELRQGSELAFKQIYEQNRDKFLNFARRYHLSDEENIDIYQDAYIIFHDNVMSGKIKELTSSISTYLFSIGKYLIFDRMRKNKKTVNSEYNLDIVRDDESVIETLDFDTGELTPEQTLLRKHFATLGKQCQELLTLFYYRGYTIREIMEAVDYNSENVVKAAKSRCMKTLRERIQAKV